MNQANTAVSMIFGSVNTINNTCGQSNYIVGRGNTLSNSEFSYVIGRSNTIGGSYSFTFGASLTNSTIGTTVFGQYNVPDIALYNNWVSGTSYSVGDIITNGNFSFKCKTANSDTIMDYSKWETMVGNSLHALIVGNGYYRTDYVRVNSNALALEWNGTLHLAGDVYVHCDADSTNGSKLAKVSELPTTMTGATSSVAGTSGLVPAPATTDVNKFLAGDGTYKSGGLPMVILSYGSSTWAEFEAAYNNNVIVYCRASSNSNPATGSQTRMAFMAYVNDAASPTNVEFQYYRSMNPSNKSMNQLSDQVFVYKLDKTSGWSVTTREASIKSIVFDASTGLTGTYNYNTGVLTITAAT